MTSVTGQAMRILLMIVVTTSLIVGGMSTSGCSEEAEVSQEKIEQVVSLRCTHAGCNGEVETTINDLLARGCIGLDFETVGKPPDKCAKCPKCNQLSLEYVNSRQEEGN